MFCPAKLCGRFIQLPIVREFDSQQLVRMWIVFKREGAAVFANSGRVILNELCLRGASEMRVDCLGLMVNVKANRRQQQRPVRERQ